MMGRIVGVLAALLSCITFLYACGTGNHNKVLRVGIYAGSYWGTPNGDCYQILDGAIRRFEDSHPGITVDYVNGIPTGAYSEWLAEQILRGEAPDLYFVLPEDFNLLVSSGALANLDTLIAGDPDFDPLLYYEPSLYSGVFSGSQYALPYAGLGIAMGNAPEEVKCAADMVTASNLEEGVYIALRNLKFKAVKSKSPV